MREALEKKCSRINQVLDCIHRYTQTVVRVEVANNMTVMKMMNIGLKINVRCVSVLCIRAINKDTARSAKVQYGMMTMMYRSTFCNHTTFFDTIRYIFKFSISFRASLPQFEYKILHFLPPLLLSFIHWTTEWLLNNVCYRCTITFACKMRLCFSCCVCFSISNPKFQNFHFAREHLHRFFLLRV